MAVYTVKILGVCGGGEHITLSVLKDGKAVRKTVVTKTDIFQNETGWSDAMIFFLRQEIKKAKATTMNEAKTAVEAASWEI